MNINSNLNIQLCYKEAEATEVSYKLRQLQPHRQKPQVDFYYLKTVVKRS